MQKNKYKLKKISYFLKKKRILSGIKLNERMRFKKKSE